MARFEDTGPRRRARWPRRSASSGPAARACGLARDVRHDHPSGIFRFAHIPVSHLEHGRRLRARLRALARDPALDRLRARAAPQPAAGATCAARSAPSRRTTSPSRSSRAGAARSATSRMTDESRPLRALQGRRSVVPQLDRPRAGAARPADLRLPALQQELQPLLLRARPVTRAGRSRGARMIDVIRARLQQGHRTMPYPDGAAAAAAGALPRPPAIDAVEVPPTAAALRRGLPDRRDRRYATAAPRRPRPLPLLHATARAPAPRARSRYTRDYRLAVRTRERPGRRAGARARASPRRSTRRLRKLFGRSLKLRQVSAGGCNACEADVNVLNTVVLRPRPLRDPVRRVAAPRRRPARHRRRSPRTCGSRCARPTTPSRSRRS